MKIVLDTNCLIMSLSRKGKYRSVWQGVLNGKYQLCVSNEIIEEYVEVISRNISPKVAEIVIYTLLMRSNVLRFDPHFRFGLIKADIDDNKFVDCAIVSGAMFIVTEDKHFGILKEIDFPRVDVVGIDEFVEELNKI